MLAYLYKYNGKKYWYCQPCDYITDQIFNMKIHHKFLHKKELLNRIAWHPERGYDCILHKNHHIHFNDGKELRLHLRYFHRHESQSKINPMQYSKQFINKIPKGSQPQIKQYIKHRDILIKNLKLTEKRWNQEESLIELNWKEKKDSNDEGT